MCIRDSGELAQARIHISLGLDELKVGTQRKELGAPARACGADAASHRESMQRPVLFADKDVAGIGALRYGGESEARVELRWQVRCV